MFTTGAWFSDLVWHYVGVDQKERSKHTRIKKGGYIEMSNCCWGTFFALPLQHRRGSDRGQEGSDSC
jgi:hypothetical protein